MYQIYSPDTIFMAVAFHDNIQLLQIIKADTKLGEGSLKDELMSLLYIKPVGNILL
jgi:hypothetical protein